MRAINETMTHQKIDHHQITIWLECLAAAHNPGYLLYRHQLE